MDVAYAGAQMADLRVFIVQAMNAIPIALASAPPADFTLKVHVSAGDTFEWSQVMLAKAYGDGTLELLTAYGDGTLELLTAAWERFLGYGRHEFEGKMLRQLTGFGETAAASMVVAILDERHMRPVDLTLRSRAGEEKYLRLHRRLDPHTRRIFIVAEETAASPVRVATQTG
jgi:hypothetical protein